MECLQSLEMGGRGSQRRHAVPGELAGANRSRAYQPGGISRRVRTISGGPHLNVAK